MKYHYWAHWHNWKYEVHKRVERFWLWVAHRAPAQLRLWIVVDSTCVARDLYPHSTGYAGPDGLTYKEIHDGALRKRPEVSPLRVAQEDACRLATALHFTQEYLGEQTLPSIDGWMWFDALNAHKELCSACVSSE